MEISTSGPATTLAASRRRAGGRPPTPSPTAGTAVPALARRPPTGSWTSHRGRWTSPASPNDTCALPGRPPVQGLEGGNPASARLPLHLPRILRPRGRPPLRGPDRGVQLLRPGPRGHPGPDPDPVAQLRLPDAGDQRGEAEWRVASGEWREKGSSFLATRHSPLAEV